MDALEHLLAARSFPLPLAGGKCSLFETLPTSPAPSRRHAPTAARDDLVLAPDGERRQRDVLAQDAVTIARPNLDLVPLGLGDSVVKVDSRLPESDAMGLGGWGAELAQRVVTADVETIAKYDRRVTRLLDEHVRKRALLPITPRPEAIGTSCVAGRSAHVPSRLKAAIDGDTRGLPRHGVLSHFRKHGFTARSTLSRQLYLSRARPTLEALAPHAADAATKDIARGDSVILGDTLEEAAAALDDAIPCTCRPRSALNVEGSGAIPKRDNDHGGQLMGARLLHSATRMNKGTEKEGWCQQDSVMVGVTKGLKYRAEYISRGHDPADVLIISGKRDLAAAYKHCVTAYCDRWLMGFRAKLWFCTACGMRRSPYGDGDCVCPPDVAPAVVREKLAYYRGASFGARSAADNFGLLSSAFRLILITVLFAAITVYVDDSYLLGVVLRQPGGQFSEHGVDLCHRLSWGWNAWSRLTARWGLDEALSKRILGTSVVNLGVVIDWYRLELRLSPVRLAEVRALLSTWKNRARATLLELQQLRGLLGFCTCVVRGARRILPLVDREMRGLKFSSQRRRLSPDFKLAVEWIAQIYDNHAGSKLILTSDWVSAARLDFATDASGGIAAGYGGYFGDVYIAGKFPPGFGAAYSIAELEMATVLVMLLTVGPALRGLRLLVRCDNTNAVSASTKGSTQSLAMQYLALALDKIADRFDIDVRILWVASKANRVADVASRDLAAFLRLPAFRGRTPQRAMVAPAVWQTVMRCAQERPWSWAWVDDATPFASGAM